MKTPRCYKVTGVAFEVRQVLAGAYRGADLEARSLLTHVLVIGEDGNDAVKTLCGRIDGDRLADSYSDAAAKAPTCPCCLERAVRTVFA